MLFKPFNEVGSETPTDLRGFCYLKVTGYLKTFIKVMANILLRFGGSSEYETFERTIETYVNDKGGLFICIEDTELEHDNSQFTVLDKSTAIKFSKELRKQIALMD